MKNIKTVFVIMPFSSTPTRKKEDLDAFFEDNLKYPIENHDGFANKYRVLRSDDSFDIGKQVVRDIYTADIVLCDLSGEHANPNVMYELGLRLALTNKPVIMFREKYEYNKIIFDVSVYHTKEYAVTRYKELEQYILDKISKFESGKEIFYSPILEILGKEPSVVKEIELKRANKLLQAMLSGFEGLNRAVAGALNSYLSNLDSDLQYPEYAEQLRDFVLDNSDVLKKLDWSKFNFHPSLHPALHSFMSNLPLDGVTDNWISQLWNETIYNYFARFFATDMYWSYLDYQSIADLLSESRIIEASLISLLQYLDSETEEEKKKYLGVMLFNLALSLDTTDEHIDELRKEI